jgi:excisionase family DNA binding protein
MQGVSTNTSSSRRAPLQVVEAVQFLTLRQVAHQLNISRRTVVRWIEAGLLPAYKFGTMIRVRPQDLEEVIRNHTLQIAGHSEERREGNRTKSRQGE